MRHVHIIFIFFLFISSFSLTACLALEPDEIVIIANKDSDASIKIARYYCRKRAVPLDNILTLSLGKNISDTISRGDYERKIVEPVRKKLYSRSMIGKIRCLLTTYGVPFKVTGRGILKAKQNDLEKLRERIKNQKIALEQLRLNPEPSAGKIKKVTSIISQLQGVIDYITGSETSASVDSELSMVLFDDYELYRWQPNKLSYKMPYWDFKSLMVCRLDGPTPFIAKTIIDKSIFAETVGLKGIAYIDSGHAKTKKNNSLFEKYDKSLHDLADLIRAQTRLPVVEETTSSLFQPGQCPSTALYCGWYSLKKYIDAFDFTDGAIGYHIASFEAIDLRDANSTQWCPAMLKDGVTATIGAVAEPYLHSFPKPREFFNELIDGRCLVEAYYRTKPFNSWQMILIGDPLYTPFPKR